MGKALGMASDFYRLRLVRLDAEEAPEFEWREDILYREPPSDEPGEYAKWRVQAVLATDDSAITLRDFEGGAEAHEWLAKAEEDLGEMTRTEFETWYFPVGE
jgi:hypothetical protein